MSVPGPSSTGSISDDTLDRAIAQGVLTAQQVEVLRHLERSRSAPAPAEPKDDEKFRFISGFSDIFVTIGLSLFLGALAYFSENLVGSIVSDIVVAVACWLLAEYFTRKSRMALPSIVLLLVYAAAGLFRGRGNLRRQGFLFARLEGVCGLAGLFRRLGHGRCHGNLLSAVPCADHHRCRRGGAGCRTGCPILRSATRDC